MTYSVVETIEAIVRINHFSSYINDDIFHIITTDKDLKGTHNASGTLQCL